jgi:hypothetical protein
MVMTVNELVEVIKEVIKRDIREVVETEIRKFLERYVLYRRGFYTYPLGGRG